MDELFVNEVQLNEKMFIALNKVSGIKAKRFPLIVSIFGLILTITLWVLNMLPDEMKWFMLVFIVILLVNVMLIFMPKIFAKSQAKRQIAQGDSLCKSIVYSDRMETYMQGISTRHDTINTAFTWTEDESYFFITKDKFSHHVFDKNGFEKGTADEFRNYLEANSSFTKK